MPATRNNTPATRESTSGVSFQKPSKHCYAKAYRSAHCSEHRRHLFPPQNLHFVAYFGSHWRDLVPAGSRLAALGDKLPSVLLRLCLIADTGLGGETMLLLVRCTQEAKLQN
jgi:hypothetical protein